MSLLFEWDPRKALLNAKKHGVSFNEAGSVFSDRHLLVMSDPDHSHHEERFVAIGFSSKGRLLVVIAAEVEKNRLRLISASKATNQEKTSYER